MALMSRKTVKYVALGALGALVFYGLYTMSKQPTGSRPMAPRPRIPTGAYPQNQDVGANLRWAYVNDIETY